MVFYKQLEFSLAELAGSVGTWRRLASDNRKVPFSLTVQTVIMSIWEKIIMFAGNLLNVRQSE